MSRYNVGAYIRLSRDESYSDSDSIDNQIKLADFDRPGFQNLLRNIECGLIKKEEIIKK